ncbi:ABZJ_00895 family protein [Enterovibrio sp. ZSDZ42]|uniref:ABZJ_00895 family protein n=1 Tax=Enterovibrio gelatinilyticus TaxID=2899819 RepID=A0ABT5R0D4_9GAMM|nr:ABZJ_00895 family protein [Enterovibrio sp. ZSDZ42]MDD1793300.1 ABZJ_00895 family protein [Enterovibrio sp. ZSDZ42]
MTASEHTANIQNNTKEPKLWQVSLALCLISVLLGVAILFIEEILGVVMPNSGVLSTVIPTMLTGFYFGHKNEVLMVSRTRWLAVMVWTGASLLYVAGIMRFYEFTLADLTAEFGSVFLWIGFAFLLIMTVVSYFMIKSGEKMGIKNRVKVREKQLAKQQAKEKQSV